MKNNRQEQKYNEHYSDVSYCVMFIRHLKTYTKTTQLEDLALYIENSFLFSK